MECLSSFNHFKLQCEMKTRGMEHELAERHFSIMTHFKGRDEQSHTTGFRRVIVALSEDA